MEDVRTGPFRFGPFVADTLSGELRRDGVRIRIQDLPFRLLVALLERPGELVTRAELSRSLWGSDTFVDEAAGLNTAVAKLREALEDDAAQPVFIETVPKRGYRFIGRLEPAVAQPAPRAPRRWQRAWPWLAGTIVVAAAATYWLAGEPRVRIAVVLFDNETGDPAVGRLAQNLTDATVFELTRQQRLAVVGNAAVLRTARPFRDLEKIRDAVQADYIVLGQVQTVDGAIGVRAHLIRGRDLAHVWVDNVKVTSAGEDVLQSTVAAHVAEAVSSQN